MCVAIETRQLVQNLKGGGGEHHSLLAGFTVRQSKCGGLEIDSLPARFLNLAQTCAGKDQKPYKSNKLRRAHGKKGKLFEAMLKRPPKNIDVMLMEGSSLGRLSDDGQFQTEEELELRFIECFKATPGLVLVACSAQNIDRVVIVYRAAKQSSRTLVVDAYAAEVLKATGSEHIPKLVRGWPNIAVYIPFSQRVQLKKKGIAQIVDSYRGFRLWPGQLAEHAPRSVMLFRP